MMKIVTRGMFDALFKFNFGPIYIIKSSWLTSKSGKHGRNTLIKYRDECMQIKEIHFRANI